jgi:SAM-dependent methyltransferase
MVIADPSAWNETSLVNWEDVPCPLCAHEHWRPLLEAADADPGAGGLRFAIVRCERCGLLYTNPRPDVEAMGRFYRPSYAAFHKPKLLRNLSRRWYPFARLIGRPCRERRVLPWHGQGRLLDFGCGGGKFLLRMQDQGWKVVGLDRSSEIVRQVRSQLGVNALSGTLPHASIQPASFDIITMWSTLAHVHQPLAALHEAHRILVPGGRLYVEVPNIGSWAFRWFGSRWTGLDLPRHLTHFSADTLRMMLESAGFRVLSTKTVVHPDWLRSSARRAGRERGSPYLLRLLRLKPIAHITSWLGYVMGRADSIMSIAERPA